VPFLFFLTSGCVSVGPEILPKDRYNYNLAMNRSNHQEILLNLVRLRYDENPMALKVSSISGSASLSNTLGLSGSLTLPNPGKGNGSLSPSPSISYSDNPVISYTPLDDQAYYQSFFSQLNLYDVYVLLKSSWSITRLMRIGFQRVGNVYNASNSARATSSHAPEYSDFLDLVDVLRRVQLAEAGTGFYAKNDDVEELILEIHKDYRFTAKERLILKKAGVEMYQHKIVFSNYPAPHKVFVVTRSLLGIYNYLSKGLVEPKEHLKNQVLTETLTKKGEHFDWQKVLGGMIKIYNSDKQPTDAYVSIYFRNYWYYIKDSDNNSKQTFTLLINVNGLVQSASPPNTAPTLTRTV
jgi:hypothetical protein